MSKAGEFEQYITDTRVLLQIGGNFTASNARFVRWVYDNRDLIARALRRDEEIERPTVITQSLGYEAAPVLAALREVVK